MPSTMRYHSRRGFKMDMALIGDVANIFAALGIILTLGFLAFEQHKNTEQAKIDTWNRVMQGLRETRRRTDSPHVADVIARGRIDYFALSAAERLTFGFFHEELLLDYDPLLHHPDKLAVSRPRASIIAAFSGYLCFPGAKAWWLQSNARTRWPEHMVEAIDEALLACG